MLLSTVLLLSAPTLSWCASMPASSSMPMSSRHRLAPEACVQLDGAALQGLTEEEARVTSWLASEEMGQAHLLDGWATATVEDKRRLLAQVVAMDEKYPADAQGRAGLTAYVAHARELLAESAAGKNPFEGCSVEVPEGELMDVGSDAFRADERAGFEAIQDAVFVLVAGGLGNAIRPSCMPFPARRLRPRLRAGCALASRSTALRAREGRARTGRRMPMSRATHPSVIRQHHMTASHA